MKVPLGVLIGVLLAGSVLAARPAGMPEPLVTLRVKDAEASEVIRSVQKQCGVRNVVIDRDVAGRASFFMTRVPCATAWSTILKTYGLTATSYSSSLAHVEARRP